MGWRLRGDFRSSIKCLGEHIVHMGLDTVGLVGLDNMYTRGLTTLCTWGLTLSIVTFDTRALLQHKASHSRETIAIGSFVSSLRFD